jgi:hypothetical protein
MTIDVVSVSNVPKNDLRLFGDVVSNERVAILESSLPLLLLPLSQPTFLFMILALLLLLIPRLSQPLCGGGRVA